MHDTYLVLERGGSGAPRRGAGNGGTGHGQPAAAGRAGNSVARAPISP
ncbi:hypothetical protein STVIR_2150 [Streptomyces viridochromogenes Tue57]|uniref:Uncharacterized protein n=1 Tax=Streptomyces viridochromogenes Tue57 TaxID=1160705 RepID=L8PH32_STRVR|nr:hypothetical protein STVIR_2150 [Streptomyces viridochromogenes Tue57]